MLKESRFFILIFFSITFLFSINFIENSFAQVYDESALSLTVNTYPNPIALDYDKDNVIDTLYSADSTSSTITFTKIFGTGQNTIVWAGDSKGKTFHVIDNYRIGVTTSVTSASCTSQVYSIDIITGGVTTVGSFGTGVSNLLCYGEGLMLDSNGYIWSHHIIPTVGDGHCRHLIGRNGTTMSTTTQTTSSYCGNVGLNWEVWFGKNGFTEEWDSSTMYYLNGTQLTGSMQDKIGHLILDSTTGAQYSLDTEFFIPSNVIKNSTLYYHGLKFPPQSNNTLSSYSSTVNWQTILNDELNLSVIPTGEEAYFLNPRIIDPSLGSSNVLVVKMLNGTEYVGLISQSSISYVTKSSIDSALTTKAFQSFLIDDWTPAIGSTQARTSPLSAEAIRITTPVTTFDESLNGIVGLVSGYYLSTQTATDRVFNPSNFDTNDLYPVIIPPTTGLTTLSVEISNAPSSALIKVVSPTYSLLSQSYVWDSKFLTADNAFASDLPSSTCVIIYMSENVLVKNYESLGTVCASGTMPKEIIYSQNLAFTFWTLPFGASHTFSETGDILTTRVRSDNAPFDYMVKVYHSNGTLYNSTSYTGVTTNSTTFDLRTFNASGADYPSRIEIYDDNGNLAYYATIGFPNYFSSISSYFAQWFVVEGFNLLYMMPIVFAAMFTRNTVGIGTGLTVVFISMMAWLGLIPIDEIIVYLLIFISVIGLLAYRTLR